MQRRPTIRGARSNRRLITFLWIAGLAALIISLIVFEQTAILYVLATLGITVLLAVVGLADLSGAETSARAIESGGDAAAIADIIPASTTSAAVKPPASAPRARRAGAAKRK